MTSTALRYDAGATWLNLLATTGNAYSAAPVERLFGVDRLAEWLDHEGLRPVTPPTAADLDATRDLRDVLRELGLGAHSGRAPDPAAVSALNRVLAAAAPLEVRPAATGLLADQPADAAAALARIAHQAATQLTGPEAGHLGRCADTECGLLYLDPTGRRRWCSAATCGVKHRVRAHRERTAGTGTPA